MTDERVGWVTDELLVEVRGDDARTWLNGQITNDLKRLTPDQPVYGLVLTGKGRILSELLAIEHPEHGLLVAVPRAAWPALREQLEHFIIMEDVTLAPREDLALVTIQGSLAAAPGLLPHARIGAGFDLVVPASEAAARLHALGARLIDEPERERRRVAAGRPRFPIDFGEHTYPHEAGLEKSAVSFQKGCYHGQEVVCMLESRGQISRRLVRLSGPAGLSAGGQLTGEDGQAVGTITSAIDEGDRSVALGIVKRALATPGARLRAGDAAVEVLGPPALG
jgi:folate-binding protein YgfZ